MQAVTGVLHMGFCVLLLPAQFVAVPAIVQVQRSEGPGTGFA